MMRTRKRRRLPDFVRIKEGKAVAVLGADLAMITMMIGNDRIAVSTGSTGIRETRTETETTTAEAIIDTIVTAGQDPLAADLVCIN